MNSHVYVPVVHVEKGKKLYLDYRGHSKPHLELKVNVYKTMQ